MSALTSLSTWLRRFFDRLTADDCVLADKGSRWFEKATRSKFGSVAEFKKLRLPMRVTNLEERVTPATTLGLGDIAFTGYQATTTDKVSFVLLRDITAGTVLTVTDNAWHIRIGGDWQYYQRQHQHVVQFRQWRHSYVVVG